jgi:para-aminobenzoate synthetase component 2
MRLLVLDNYDSFTFNLVQYLGELGAETDVVRNDVAKAPELVARGHAGIVISPGPGDPSSAGESIPLVHACAEARRPLLGVCLGHQSIGAAFCARDRSCTARSRRSRTTGAACSRGCRRRSRRRGITRS